jgi:hypothetical protein
MRSQLVALTDLIKHGTAGLATATTATERSADLQSVAKVAVATTVHKKNRVPIEILRRADTLFETINEAVKSGAIDPSDAESASLWVRTNKGDGEYLDHLQLLLQWCLLRSKHRQH